MSDCDEINVQINDKDSKNFEDKQGFVSLKKFSIQISSKFTLLNEDLNLFGHFQIIGCKNGDLCVDFNEVFDGVEQILRLYKEKVKMLDDSDDRIRYSDNEILRLKKLLSRKTQEYETMAADCTRLRDTLNDIRTELRHNNKQLVNEKNNVKILNSTITRERNQMKNEKSKLEREMTSLKERMNKLLSDPKKPNQSIEINSTELLSNPIKSGQKQVLIDEKYENQINDELISSFRRQLEDVILENRHLREQLISHLVQLKQLTHFKKDPISKISENQRNNSGLSRHSSDSDISTKSNETFIVSHPKSEIDERLYLEMPFDVIKDDLSTLFVESYESINKAMKGVSRFEDESSFKLTNCDICTNVELVDATSSENINRLQKEIFQLRRQLIDYESIIQSKDSLLEVAIEQRIRRGSLLPK